MHIIGERGAVATHIFNSARCGDRRMASGRKSRQEGHLTPLKPRVARLKRLWQQKRPLWVTLAIFFLVGSLLILLTSGFLHEVGIAFLISALLGFSIDFYLRQNIARDAFEGAMGYFLPDEVKEAVRYIGGIEWFAEEFSLTVNLQKIDIGTIKCTIRTRKYLRNISNSTKSMKSNIHVDEWVATQNRILTLAWQRLLPSQKR